jgi:hypothetical protein
VKTNFQNLRYILRHKKYVLLALWRIGGWRTLWTGITHDLSKFSSAEWHGYANWFFGPNGIKLRSVPGNMPTITVCLDQAHQETKQASYYAWNHHQKCNKHHWDYWVMTDGVILEMPDRYITEMVCDWWGAGMAQGKNDLEEWYQANKDKMALLPETQERVETLIQKITSLKG